MDLTKFVKFLNRMELEYDNDLEYIYHYTSSVGAKGILENSKIRFTDRDYLNDYSEGVYVLELCQQNLDDLMQDGELKRAVKISLKKRIEDHHIDNCYMYQCSFSTNKDSLCMWNYYTKSQGIKGYNIKFNAQNIKTRINIDVNPNILKTNDFPIYSGKVIYEKHHFTTFFHKKISYRTF